MNVYIDFSLLTGDGIAVGRVHGSVTLACAPSVGVSISFLYPRESASFPTMNGFTGLLPVASLQLAADSASDAVLALLENVILSTREDALTLVKFLQTGFGLLFEEYE